MKRITLTGMLFAVVGCSNAGFSGSAALSAKSSSGTSSDAQTSTVGSPGTGAGDSSSASVAPAAGSAPASRVSAGQVAGADTGNVPAGQSGAASSDPMNNVLIGGGTTSPSASPVLCDGVADGTVQQNTNAFSVDKAPVGAACSSYYAQKKCVSGSWKPVGTEYAQCKEAKVLTPVRRDVFTQYPGSKCETQQHRLVSDTVGEYVIYCFTGYASYNNVFGDLTVNNGFLPDSGRILSANIESIASDGNAVVALNGHAWQGCPYAQCNVAYDAKSDLNQGSDLHITLNIQMPCNNNCQANGNFFLRVQYSLY